MRLPITGRPLTIYHVLLKLVPPRGHDLLHLCLGDLRCLLLRCFILTQVDGLAESANTNAGMVLAMGMKVDARSSCMMRHYIGQGCDSIMCVGPRAKHDAVL